MNALGRLSVKHEPHATNVKRGLSRTVEFQQIRSGGLQHSVTCKSLILDNTP
jgi:hypothetical protein